MVPETLIHIRHGETDWNLARRLQGSQDIPLNDTGRGQARRNGQRLQSLLADFGRSPAEFDWIASPMQRARETMEIIRREMDLPIGDYRIEPLLSEVSFGRFEGLTYEDVEREDPASMAAIRSDKWNFVPPGGENYVMLSDRVGKSLDKLQRDTVVVSHGGVFRALLGILRQARDQELAEMAVPQDVFFVHRRGTESWV